MSIELDSVIVRTDEVMTAPLDQEVVILNLTKNDYVNLNPVGKRIWDLLEKPLRVSDLCQKLSDQFDATPDQIAADVLPFLNQLHDESLIDLA